MSLVRTRGYAQHVEIAVPIERVWAALTHVPTILRWYADRAIIEPRPGGRFFVERKDRGGRDAQIDIFEPNRRLRLVYLKSTGAPPSNSALVDDFLLDSKDSSAVLRVLGSGVPDTPEWDPIYARLRLGWPILFRQLRLMLEEDYKQSAPASVDTKVKPADTRRNK
jgi:uncharacterized protein YndB with AHSA1/START domain